MSPAPLGWRPFIDPTAIHDLWFLLLIPIAVLVSLAWKAVRINDVRQLPRQTGVMATQVVLAMIGLGLAAYVAITLVIPLLADLSR